MDLKSLIKQLTRVPAMLIAPLMGVFISFKRYLNPRSLIGRIASIILNTFKKVFSFRPKSMGDYYKFGRYYVFKNLAYLIILGICLIPFIYFRFIAPAAAVSVSAIQEGKMNTFFYTDEQLESYSGNAKILSNGDKLRYQGEVSGGLCTGDGMLYNRDGVLVYEGAFNKNQYEGEGREYYSDTGNLKYKGNFKENLFEGEGILYFPDGMTKRYEGSFVAGVFEGEGILYNRDGQKIYEGEFKDGLYDGEGTQYFSDREKPLYIGEFVKGLKEGTGQLYNERGTMIFEGPFSNDEINVVAFLGGPLETVKNAYKTAGTDYTYDAMDEIVVAFEDFTDLFVIDDVQRVEKIVRLESNIPNIEGIDYFTGNTYADEADLAALNITGIRSDFKKVSPGTNFTQEVYRPQEMFVKTYVMDDIFCSAFSESEDSEPIYYVIEKR